MTLLFAFLFMLLTVAAMAVGVMFGRQPIAGSCGGLKTLGIDGECEICGGNPARCDSTNGVASFKDASVARRLGVDAAANPEGAQKPQHTREL
jgi:hypothetical protein